MICTTSFVDPEPEARSGPSSVLEVCILYYIGLVWRGVRVCAW